MRSVLPSRAIFPFALLLLSVYASAQGTHYQAALAAYRNQDYKNAAALFAQAELDAPGKTDALLYEGNALAHLAQLSQADKVLSNYLRDHPDSFEGLEALGKVQQREDKPADSLATFTKAAKIHTPTSSDLTSAALDYILLNDYPDAIHWLLKAVQFDPDNGLAWYDLGRCEYTQSHFLDAQKDFERAEMLLPGDYHVPENLALTLEAENILPTAEEQYRKSITLAEKYDQGDEWPYLNYGTFLLTHDRGSDAISPLQRSVSVNPSCASCREMLGRALASNGEVKQGIQQLELAVALAPNDGKLHYELGRLYHQAGEDAKAKAEFDVSARMYKPSSASGAQN